MADNKKEVKFAKGVFVKEVFNGAIVKVSIKVEDFCENEINEAGYINVDIKRTKNGKLYAVIDDFKPAK